MVRVGSELPSGKIATVLDPQFATYRYRARWFCAAGRIYHDIVARGVRDIQVAGGVRSERLGVVIEIAGRVEGNGAFRATYRTNALRAVPGIDVDRAVIIDTRVVAVVERDLTRPVKARYGWCRSE
jgi:hypothetical protein